MKIKAEWIRDLRNRHRITQVQLAESLFHVKRDRIADWETNRRNCPPIIFWAMKLTWDKEDIWGK